MEYKCLCCNKNYQHKFDERLKERVFNTYKFPNHDNIKFIILLRKGAYPYEFINNWEKIIETSLPEKEDFHSHINIEDITDANYAHAKRVSIDFEIKSLGEHHDVLKYMSLILHCKISFSSWISIASRMKTTKIGSFN